MKQDFEHRNKEREIFYQSFESYITGILPPSSPQLLDSLKNFIQQPIELQKNILKEIALKNGVSIIPLVKQFISQNENVAEMLIEVLMEDANEITASILSGLAEEINEKRTKKLFKKALFNLKTRGIECPYTKEEDKPIFKKIFLPQPKAYISNIDSRGDRLLMLTIPESLHFSQLYSFIINDQSGIRELQEVFLKKKELMGYLEGYNQTPITIVDVDYPYAQQILSCAYQKNLDNGIPLPSHFSNRHKTLFPVGHDEITPIIYTILNREEIEKNSILLEHALDLFKTREISNWLADEQPIAEFRRKIEDLKTSSLIVSKVAQEERIESIINEATYSFFSSERCTLYKRRLEESAYIFWKTDRQREAKISLAVANSLTTGKVHLETLLFPRELIRKSLFYQKEEGRDSPIIVPNSRLIL